MATSFEQAKVTVPGVLDSKGERKLTMLTAYDCTMARLAEVESLAKGGSARVQR